MKSLCIRLYCLVFSLISFPAMAEVCDKERPDWNPSDGPVSQLDDLLVIFTSKIGIALIAMTLIALIINQKYLSIFVAIILLVFTYIPIDVFFINISYITQGAINEGCVAKPYLIILVLISMIALLLWRLRK